MSLPPSNKAAAFQASSTPRLRAALEICLMLLVAGTALLHPLCLSTDALGAIHARLEGTAVFPHLRPWVSCGFSPLVLKESWFLTVTIALLFLFSWVKIRGQWMGSERSAFGDGNGSWRSLLLKPELWALMCVLYFALSVAWSQVFQHSLTTWVLASAGIAVLLITRSTVAQPQFAVKFMVLCIICGVVIASVALFQHLGKMPFLPQPDDPRNRMSSLIGHNTGMSSWLMFPLSFCFYFAIINRRLWVRTCAILVIVLFVLVIIAAQSRAVWILAAAICVTVPWQIYRILRKRLSLTAILTGTAILLTLVIGLSLSPQKNPLARLPISLQERITGHILNLDQLRRETRLRILVVSMVELFPRAPLFGTGLGSFAWEYPKAQGDYFAANPDTRLGTTTRRTDLTHNDYLQTLVETGLIGLCLVLGGIYVFGRESWLNYRRLVHFRDRAIWWALATPVTGVLLHALVDFPFHVVPIAVVAIISACLTTRIVPPTPAAESPVLPVPEVSTRSANKATGAALLATLVIFSWVPWGWQALVGRILVSDSYYNGGLIWLQEYLNLEGQTLQRRLATVDRARRSFREAVILNVFNGEAYEGQATAIVNRAALLLHELEQVAPDGNLTTAAEAMRKTILSDSQTAIAVTENQVRAAGLRYHYTYYLLGRAWRMQWELEKHNVAPQDSKSYQEAVRALRMAIHFNPADSTSIQELADLLEESQATVTESRQLRNLLFTIDSWSADELLLQPALKLASQGQIPTATAMLEPVFVEQPRHPRVMLAKIWLAYFEAVWPPPAIDKVEREYEYLRWRQEKLTPARSLIDQLPDTGFFLPQKQRLKLLYTAASGEIEVANRLARVILENDIWNREARAIYYWTQHKLYGGVLQHEDSIEYFRTRALLAIYFMPPRKSGLSLAVVAGQESLPDSMKITVPEMRRLVAFCVANDWWEFLSLFMPSLLKLYPGDEQLKRNAAEMEKRLNGN